ncbi:MAG: hypothetical protein ACRDYF_05125, partial [Acidimicrobiia bacterium]
GLAVFALWEPDTLPERLEIATELYELAKRRGDPVLEIDAGVALYYAAAQHGDADRAREALSMATLAADALGQPALRLRTLVAQENCAMLDGRFADFTRFAAEALHFGEALGNPDRLINYHGDGGINFLLQGRLDEALEGLETMLGVFPPVFADLFLPWPFTEVGRHAEAAEHIASLGGPTLRDVPRGYAWVYGLAFLAPPCAALGDRELARRLHDELLPYRSQMVMGQVSTVGPVAHYLGILAGVLDRLDEAEEHFAFAADLAERSGARGMLIRTRLEWARLALRRNTPADAERARKLATAARDLCEELGTPDLAKQAAELLATNAG